MRKIVLVFVIIGIIFSIGVFFLTKDQREKSAGNVDEIEDKGLRLDNDRWYIIDDATKIRRYEYSDEDNSGIIQLIRIDPKEYEMKIEYSSEASYISDKELSDPGFVLNSGYFDKDYNPIGFLLVENERLDNHISAQTETGLVVYDEGEFELRDLGENPITGSERFDYALQTFPFIIKSGEGNISPNSTDKARRTAIGVDKNGFVYIIVSPQFFLSLYDFMNELQNTDIDFEYVLNLDGGTSTGIKYGYENFNQIFDSLVKVPTFLRFERN